MFWSFRGDRTMSPNFLKWRFQFRRMKRSIQNESFSLVDKNRNFWSEEVLRYTSSPNVTSLNQLSRAKVFSIPDECDVEPELILSRLMQVPNGSKKWSRQVLPTAIVLNQSKRHWQISTATCTLTEIFLLSVVHQMCHQTHPINIAPDDDCNLLDVSSTTTMNKRFTEPIDRFGLFPRSNPIAVTI